MTQKTKYLVVLGITLLGFILVEIYKPKPVIWTPTYSNQDDIPFGGEILYKILPELFPSQEIHDEKFPVLARHTEQSVDLQRTSYINICNTFTLDSISLTKLLQFVSTGNTAFISAEDFGSLGDTLHLSTDYISILKKGTATTLNFTHPELRQKKPFIFRMEDAEAFFVDTNKPTIPWTVLAYNHLKKPTFIKVKWGKGTLLLNSTPRVFSNYYLIKPQNCYFAINAFRYLPQQTIYWDEYYQAPSIGARFRVMNKSIHKASDASYDESPFRFIVSQPALRWAYYLTLLALIFFMFFEAKRRQRIIPVIDTPQNTSVLFVKTIGQLYFNKKEHLTIAQKKIAHFLHFIRDKFYLNTLLVNEDFLDELSNKSGVELGKLQALFHTIQQLNLVNSISEKELIALNKAIEEFYQTVKA